MIRIYYGLKGSSHMYSRAPIERNRDQHNTQLQTCAMHRPKGQYCHTDPKNIRIMH